MSVRRNLSVDAEELLLQRFTDTSSQRLGEIILNSFLAKYRSLYGYRVILEPRTTPKSMGRCITKVLGYIESRIATDEIDAIMNHLKDLAGARLIFIFPDDSKQSVSRLRSYINSLKSSDGLPEVELDGDNEDKSYKTGYRAVHQGLKLKNDNGTWLPFEVQFMNALQHVWDKVQGPLYRDPNRYPQALHKKMATLSKRCEKMCDDYEKVLQEIQTHNKRAH